MANENDVVRLKHLQPLVSGVANDFSIQNGDDAVRLKHLVSLASALDKQAPVLSLGSWSAVDSVYSAPITYTGDGTLSTDIGTISNDILTVEDADGNFNGVISAAGGNDFADSSLAFNFTTDTITIQGGEDRKDPTFEFISATSGNNNITINVYSDSNSSITLFYRNKSTELKEASFSTLTSGVTRDGNNWSITKSDFRQTGTITAVVRKTSTFYAGVFSFSY